MTVSELINLLDTKENRYGGGTGKEREISICVNGIFLGYIEEAEMDGHGDGLVTDVALCVHTDRELEEELEDNSIRPKADICREFVERLSTERERNKISNRKRIKQFIENTIRQACDEMSDIEEESLSNVEAVMLATKMLVQFSEIYKNMGFDKENDGEEARKADICKEFTEKFINLLNYQTKIPHSFAIYVHDTIEQVLAKMEKE